ncbi:MAG: hypothetical protein M3133_03420 [Actinomycetota bacterium]|nr:hypothetical protein [Actinomycetota bacterium]
MQRLAVTFLFLVVPVALATYGMWRGYLHRRARDEALYAPLPARPRPSRPADATVRYTGTTRDSNWIERVALGGLFGPGPCALWIEQEGLVFARDRGPVVRVAPILAVGVERGHAAQAPPAGRTLVVRWLHSRTDGSSVELDSGFVCGSRQQADDLAQRLRDLARARQ